jgi:hypothetical protein
VHSARVRRGNVAAVDWSERKVLSASDVDGDWKDARTVFEIVPLSVRESAESALIWSAIIERQRVGHGGEALCVLEAMSAVTSADTIARKRARHRRASSPGKRREQCSAKLFQIAMSTITCACKHCSNSDRASGARSL